MSGDSNAGKHSVSIKTIVLIEIAVISILNLYLFIRYNATVEYQVLLLVITFCLVFRQVFLHVLEKINNKKPLLETDSVDKYKNWRIALNTCTSYLLGLIAFVLSVMLIGNGIKVFFISAIVYGFFAVIGMQFEYYRNRKKAV